jgi:hypothetical protein
MSLNNFNEALRNIYGWTQQEIDLIMQRFGMLDEAYPSVPTNYEDSTKIRTLKKLDE